jgi:hypothetical protein
MPPLAALAPPTGPAEAAAVLFALCIGHAVADFALQGRFLATAKNRHNPLDDYFGEKGAPKGIWIHALAAHSLIHAGTVWLVTGSAVLGFLECLFHAAIDFAKCEGWTSFRADQALHFACKVAWTLLLWWGCGWVWMV